MNPIQLLLILCTGLKASANLAGLPRDTQGRIIDRLIYDDEEDIRALAMTCKDLFFQCALWLAGKTPDLAVYTSTGQLHSAARLMAKIRLPGIPINGFGRNLLLSMILELPWSLPVDHLPIPSSQWLGAHGDFLADEQVLGCLRAIIHATHGDEVELDEELLQSRPDITKLAIRLAILLELFDTLWQLSEILQDPLLQEAMTSVLLMRRDERAKVLRFWRRAVHEPIACLQYIGDWWMREQAAALNYGLHQLTGQGYGYIASLLKARRT